MEYEPLIQDIDTLICDFVLNNDKEIEYYHKISYKNQYHGLIIKYKKEDQILIYNLINETYHTSISNWIDNIFGYCVSQMFRNITIDEIDYGKIKKISNIKSEIFSIINIHDILIKIKKDHFIY